MSNETEEIEIEDPETVTEETIEKKPEHTGGEPIPEKETKIDDELDEAFERFRSSKSEHKVEKESEESDDFIPDDDKLDIVESFKLKIFMGLFFSLLDGIHIFIYRFIAKFEFDREDLKLDEGDKEALMAYFKTKRVMALINKLPSEIIGLFHMEYIYFTKFQDLQKAHAKKDERRELYKKVKGETEESDGAKKKTNPKRKKPKRRTVKKKAVSE